MLVLGAGSIGTRHARNLLAAGAAVTVVDEDAGRSAVLEAEGAVAATFPDVLGSRFNGAVVATPTSLHVEHVLLALELAERVLVEKPLAMTSEEAAPLLQPGVAERVAVGYNLRFHEPIRRLFDLVHAGEVGTVRGASLWFGSFLPDWRPSSDYRRSYSARADLGGGVLLDAIHEIDLLLWLLGPGDYAVVGAVLDRVGGLEIDVEDVVAALLRGPRGELVELHLDYLSRRYRRGVEVLGDEATARLDWARAALEVEDAERLTRQAVDIPVARSYELQAQAFLDWVRGGTPLPVDATEGARSVALAEAIKRASTP